MTWWGAAWSSRVKVSTLHRLRLSRVTHPPERIVFGSDLHDLFEARGLADYNMRNGYKR